MSASGSGAPSVARRGSGSPRTPTACAPWPSSGSWAGRPAPPPAVRPAAPRPIRAPRSRSRCPSPSPSPSTSTSTSTSASSIVCSTCSSCTTTTRRSARRRTPGSSRLCRFVPSIPFSRARRLHSPLHPTSITAGSRPCQPSTRQTQRLGSRSLRQARLRLRPAPLPPCSRRPSSMACIDRLHFPRWCTPARSRGSQTAARWSARPRRIA
mmetsp:Transcript_15580/g.59124  ORF Transcript_15580/g.59124 Transcript_15580/m.59124 type:complete len:210 (+) Transcript_15580:518-1147(+)